MSASPTAIDLQPTFDVLPLSAEVRRAIDDLGYQTPTPVQLAVFELAKQGADLVVQARTGTGKTAAFGLPLVDGLVQPKTRQVQAIVLCPTRELALQVSREVTALSAHTGVSVVCVYGGAAMSTQVDALQKGAQVLVGTPGRVLDHIGRGTLRLDAVRVFVLDECDEMLSMGFLPQIDKVWSALPKKLQVLLFSATIPREVMRIAESRLKQPQFITLSGDHIGALEIAHFVYLSRGNKHHELLQVLEVENPESAIVFCNTRDETKQVASALQAKGYAADWLNADLPQNDRENVMRRTRNGELRFLVCTDVAARGIDISHLSHVINFDFPDSTEQYVHRTGRTGRAGRMGTALSLVTPSEIGNLYYLRLRYKIRPVEKQLPSALELRTRAESDVLAQLYSELPATPSAEQRALAQRLLTHDHAERLIAGLLGSHLSHFEQPWQRAADARRTQNPAADSELADVAPHVAPAPSPASEQRASPARRAPPVSASAADSKRPERKKPSTKAARAEPRSPRPRAARPDSAQPAVFEQDGIRYQVDDSPPDAAANSTTAATTNPVETAPQDSREVYVNVGRKDGASAEDLRALLSQHAISPEDIRGVSVRFRNSFVQVQPAALQSVIDVLNGKTLAGRELRAEESRSHQGRN